MYVSVVSYGSLPYHFVYFIWWECNSSLSQDKQVPSEVFFGLIEKLKKEFKCEPKQKKTMIPTMSSMRFEIPWGFFDGSSQGHPPRCKVGVVLFITSKHFFHIIYAPSLGSNTKAEFLALYSLLFFAKSHGLNHL
jgi:hypothetical protein